MCGIAGWVDWQGDLTREAPTISRMAQALDHRGPDAQGQWLSGHVALAHRRLIVIDRETGGQPMTYREGDRTYAITYNGEIYNFRELRCELESHGHTFQTKSDTEVLLHAYVQWGEECVHHLNGIFAFGLWDAAKQQLMLARDHLGVKPLFYAQRGRSVLFASELKGLLAHPWITAEVDAAGLAEVLTLVRTPGSGIYRDVCELRPGHLAICREQGTHIRRYWALRSAPHVDDLQTTAERVRALLEDSVRRQLIADVPVVSLLSGGLDSSGITALAADEFKRAGQDLHTYSVDFVDSARHFQSTPLHASLDEPWVKRVAEHVGTRHHTITVEACDLVDNLLIPLYAHDFPTAGQMTSSMYLLFKAIKQEATVALSGESADEVFGGYPWFHREAALQAPTFPWLMAFHGQMENRMEWLSPEVAQRVRLFDHIDQEYHRSIAEVPRLPGENAAAARIREMFYLNLTHFLPFLLERKDRMSMATGLEVRVPFCDHRLVEYVWNIPWEMKTIDSLEKGILRRAFQGLLPEDARLRKKSAYPTAQNPAYDEATRDWAHQVLNDSNAPIQPLLNPAVVGDLEESRAFEQSPVMLVTPFERIIQINQWLKEYRVTLVG